MRLDSVTARAYLRHKRGESYAEIAVSEGVSRNTVASRIRHERERRGESLKGAARKALVERVVEVVKAGDYFSDIAEREHITRSAVSGIAWRARVAGQHTKADGGRKTMLRRKQAPAKPAKPAAAPILSTLGTWHAQPTPQKHRCAGVTADDPTALAAAALLSQAKKREKANQAAREVRTL